MNQYYILFCYCFRKSLVLSSLITLKLITISGVFLNKSLPSYVNGSSSNDRFVHPWKQQVPHVGERFFLKLDKVMIK